MNHLPCEISYEELVAAYYHCRTNKRTSTSALEFEINLEENLDQLYNDLTTGNYIVGPSICFVVTKPRTREIWAAEFRDRIVHHLIYLRLEQYWNNRFSADSCACIPKRGTTYAAERLEKHIRSATNNWTKPVYYLKCDLFNFFASIDKTVLWRIMKPSIKLPWLRSLVKLVLFNDPTKNFQMNSSDYLASLVPMHKRLSNQPKYIGLPIGNLTSQFFANILLNELDQYVKRQLKIKYYIRYVDDCIILADSTKQLSQILAQLSNFVSTLNLKFNQRKCYIHSVNRGVSFVGQTVFPFRRVILKSTMIRSLDLAKTSPKSCTSIAGFFKQAGKYQNLLNKLEEINEIHSLYLCRR